MGWCAPFKFSSLVHFMKFICIVIKLHHLKWKKDKLTEIKHEVNITKSSTKNMAESGVVNIETNYASRNDRVTIT